MVYRNAMSPQLQDTEAFKDVINRGSVGSKPFTSLITHNLQ